MLIFLMIVNINFDHFVKVILSVFSTVKLLFFFFVANKYSLNNSRL